MNTKIAVIVVFAMALVTAVCSFSRGSEKDMPYKQLIRQLRKKERSMQKRFWEGINMKSKRNDCPLYEPCEVAVDCEISTCDGIPLKCYPDETGICGLDHSYSYRR